MTPAHPLSQTGAAIDFPRQKGFSHTTHLGIGAHSDDLEIMAYHGIAECYERDDSFFSGITVTNGVGSPQNQNERLEHEELRLVRQTEQRAAAHRGRYGFIAQLDYESSQVKGNERSQVRDEILAILKKSRPKVVYLHQPADKHPTHLAVLQASIEALRLLPAQDQPEQVYGCEVWRDLDWLADEKKIYLPTDKYPDLAFDLISLFESQIRAGTAYHHGTIGRRLSNGTFADPHTVREGESFTLAIDLLPVVKGQKSLKDLVTAEIDAFRLSVSQEWDILED